MPSMCQISYLVVVIEIELFLKIFLLLFFHGEKMYTLTNTHSQKLWKSTCLCEKSMHLDTYKSICRFVCIYVYICNVYSLRIFKLKRELNDKR